MSILRHLAAGKSTDVVITCAAGHLLDLTFYRTITGITAAEHIAKLIVQRQLPMTYCPIDLNRRKSEYTIPSHTEAKHRTIGIHVNIMELGNGNVVRETRYFADPIEAPHGGVNEVQRSAGPIKI